MWDYGYNMEGVLDGGLGELGWNPFRALKKIKINLKPPKRIRMGPITITRKDWIRGPVTAALMAAGPGGWGTLYAAYKGWIPGVKLSRSDRRFLREHAKIAAASAAVVGAAVAAPAVVPAIASGAGSAAGMVAKGASAAVPLISKVGKTVMKAARSEPIMEFVKGMDEGRKEITARPMRSRSGPTLQRMRPEMSATASGNIILYGALAAALLFMMGGKK